MLVDTGKMRSIGETGLPLAEAQRAKNSTRLVRLAARSSFKLSSFRTDRSGCLDGQSLPGRIGNCGWWLGLFGGSNRSLEP